MKDIANDADKEMHRTRYMERGAGPPCPLWAHHSPEALQTLSF
jgi:hypothetical protein